MNILNNENFENTTKDGYTIVDFYADWCGPCQMLKPVFEEVSKEVEGINFAKIDTEKSPELSQKFGIRSIPTLIMLKNGEEINRFSGFLPKEELKKQIESMK